MKNIFISLLLFCCIASAQGQHVIGSPISAGVGSKFNPATGVSSLDTTTTPIEATWFGAVADGTPAGGTDNHNALKAWLAAGHVGHFMHLPRGGYYVGSADSVAGLFTSQIYGDDTSTTVYYNSPSFIYLTGAMKHTTIHNIRFVCVYVHTAQDFSNSAIWTAGNIVEDSRITENQFESPTNNADAMVFSVQAGGLGGHINGLTIDHNRFINTGQTCITIQDRGSIDSCKNVWIEYNKSTGMGVANGGPNGMFVTLDGNGTGVTVNHNTIKNAYDEGIENTGYNNVEVGWNQFYQSAKANPTYPIYFTNSWATWSNCYIHDNTTVDTSTNGFVFIGGQNSRVERNVCLMRGTAQVFYRNSTNLSGRNNFYAGEGPIVVSVQGYAGGICNKNTFTDEWIDNSVATSNTSPINFDGGKSTQNSFVHPTVNKGTGGSYTSNTDTATQNTVTNLVLSSDTTNYAFATATIAMSDADTTLTGDNDINAIPYYRVTGTFTATRNFKFNNRAHTGFTVLNGANNTLNVVYVGTASSVPLPAGQTATFFNDGTTLRSNLNSGGTTVASFNSRTGAVVPAANDYSFAQLSSPPTTVSGYGIADAATLTGTQTLTNKTLTAPTIGTPTLNGPLYNATIFTGTTQTLTAGTTMWVYNGSAASVLTLPAISGNTGVTFIVKNISTFQITLNVLNTGTERIYTTHGATVYGIQPGESWMVYNDGTRWDVTASFQLLKYFYRTTVSDVAYSTTTIDELIAYTTLTAARTVTLVTTGLTAGKQYIIKDETGNAATNNITVAGTIDGGTNKVISTAYGSLRVYYNGSAWFTY